MILKNASAYGDAEDPDDYQGNRVGAKLAGPAVLKGLFPQRSSRSSIAVITVAYSPWRFAKAIAWTSSPLRMKPL